MRRFRGMLLDRLVASDPGLIRLLMASRVLLSVILSLTVLTTIGLGLPAVLLGSVVGMLSPFMAVDPKPAQRAVTLLLLPVPAAVSITLAAALGGYPLLADAVFVAVIFVAVYLRRFDTRGFGLGMLAFMPFFFALFVHATIGLLPRLLLAVVIGVACASLAVFVLVPNRRNWALRRMISAFRARMAQVVVSVLDLLAGEELTERQRALMRSKETRLHECALMIEAELDGVLPDEEAKALRRLVIGIELAVERLAVTARRVDADDLRPEQRLRLRCELRELLALVRRDPRRLPAGEGEVATVFLARERDIDHGTPAAGRLRRAMTELAHAVAKGRTLTEALQPRIAPATPAESALPASRAGAPEDPVSAAAFARFVDEPEQDDPAPVATGWQRPTTRQALQVAVAATAAIVVGEALSPQRWYWAVITAFVVFAGTSSRGDILVKGMRRFVGTLLGVFGGMLLAFAAQGDLPLMLAVILGCIFCAFYVIQVSYGLMTFFITLMLGVLYDLLGTFSPAVMVLRLEETTVGVVAGGFAAIVVLPTSTIGKLRTELITVLRTLQQFVEHAVQLLVEGESVDLIDAARDIDRELATLRLTAHPLVHRISPFRARRDDVGYALTLLAACAFYARSLATNAESACLSADERLVTTGLRISRNLDQLVESVEQHGSARPLVAGDMLSVAPAGPADSPAQAQSPRRRRILDGLDRLDEMIMALARPLDLPAEPRRPEHAREPAATEVTSRSRAESTTESTAGSVTEPTS